MEEVTTVERQEQESRFARARQRVIESTGFAAAMVLLLLLGVLSWRWDYQQQTQIPPVEGAEPGQGSSWPASLLTAAPAYQAMDPTPIRATPGVDATSWPPSSRRQGSRHAARVPPRKTLRAHARESRTVPAEVRERLPGHLRAAAHRRSVTAGRQELAQSP
jgi:hypothetical protein